MTALRRVALLGLGLAYVHSVFGAIVRISGSGMGCGEHWPDCNGAFVPVVRNYTVAVEVTHRYLAATLLATMCALVLLAMARRREPGVGGAGGVLRPAILALALVVTAAVVGMLVVMLSLSNPYLIAVHYTIAMATLAVLVVAAQRAGALGAETVRTGAASLRVARAAAAAAGLAFVTVVLGALTANVPGAAPSCRGFPWCRNGILTGGTALDVQIVHRVLAMLLTLHLLGVAIGVVRRREPPAVVRAAVLAVGVVLLQVGVAAALVELGLPPILQSLHQAVGTFLWVVVFALAALAYRGAVGAAARSRPSIAVPTEAVA